MWTLTCGGETAGYFELQRHADGTVEVMYFGLVESFIGRGLGGWLLTRAVEEAFALGRAARDPQHLHARLAARATELSRARLRHRARGSLRRPAVPPRARLTLERSTEPA